MNIVEYIFKDDPSVLKIFLLEKSEDRSEPQYEVHFAERVEFWSLDGRKLKESKVKVLSWYPKSDESKTERAA